MTTSPKSLASLARGVVRGLATFAAPFLVAGGDPRSSEGDRHPDAADAGDATAAAAARDAASPGDLPRGGDTWRGGRRGRLGLLTFLLACGVVIHVWSAMNARFTPEEASFWSEAVGIVRLESFPGVGHPISGTSARHPGPLFFWLIALSQLVSRSPLAGYVFFSLLGVAGLVVFARVIARRWSPGAGLLTLALGTFSPWWIVYTNAAWPSYLAPSLCAFAIAGLLTVLDRPRSRAVGPLLALLLAGFQIHLSILHLWILAGVAWVVYRPVLNRRWLVGGVVLGLASYIPYVVYEIRFHLENTRALLARTPAVARSPRELAGLYLYFLGFSTTDISYLWNQGFWIAFNPLRFWHDSGVARTTQFFRGVGPPWFLWLAHATGWLLVAAGLVTGAVRARRLRGHPAGALWLLFGVAVADIALLYLLSGRAGFAHYVNMVQPLAFVPVVFALTRALDDRLARWGAVACVAVLAVGGLLVTRAYYRSDSRLSVGQTDAVVRFVLARTRSRDGEQRPFRMHFGFGPAWPYPFQQIAARRYRATWPVTDTAPESFSVDSRFEPRAGRDLTPARARLVLDTITVRYENATGPP